MATLFFDECVAHPPGGERQAFSGRRWGDPDEGELAGLSAADGDDNVLSEERHRARGGADRRVFATTVRDTSGAFPVWRCEVRAPNADPAALENAVIRRLGREADFFDGEGEMADAFWSVSLEPGVSAVVLSFSEESGCAEAALTAVGELEG